MAVTRISEAIRNEGRATWVLAGGRVPMVAYGMIAGKADEAVDWSKVSFLIGDERCVPFDDPESSWSQIEDALLSHLDLSPSVKRPSTERSAEEAADNYETYMSHLPHDSRGYPVLDHVWLGIGEDGHTLSLFPGHPSLEPTEEFVIPVHDSPKPPPDRISLTLAALRGARDCLVITAGEGKADIVRRAFDGDTSLPIVQAINEIEAAGGTVTWLLDEAAADKL